MLKVKIDGEPDEIAAFFSHIEDCEGLRMEYQTAISKRAAHHKWGSSKAGIHAESVGISADVSVYGEWKAKGKSQKGFVYLLPAYGAEGVMGYKIGKTTNAHSRRKTFGIKLNFDVKFLAVVSTDDHSALETKLHRQYADKRRGSSEWFNLNEDDVKHIQSLMSAADEKLLKEVNRD